ncbi:MAG: hypothetical protein KAS17_00770, partial [Victivallaceae bacterium]|nr:hypothetical protein [Victivallaceae bacterium]
NKFQLFDELAAEAGPGANGLKIDLMEPPRYIDDTRENVSRAVMESAAKLLNEKLETLALKGIKFNSAVMVGGPSKSPEWPRIVEEITGISLSIGSQHAGAKGAAIMAGIGIGIYKNEYNAIKQEQLQKHKKIFRKTIQNKRVLRNKGKL